MEDPLLATPYMYPRVHNVLMLCEINSPRARAIAYRILLGIPSYRAGSLKRPNLVSEDSRPMVVRMAGPSRTAAGVMAERSPELFS
jgi:hypothetical protein